MVTRAEFNAWVENENINTIPIDNGFKFETTYPWDTLTKHGDKGTIRLIDGTIHIDWIDTGWFGEGEEQFDTLETFDTRWNKAYSTDTSMTTTSYTCHSPDVSDEPMTVQAVDPESAAEQYVDENLEFDPTDPQSTIEIEVTFDDPEFENKKTTRLIEITIDLTWTASAERS